MKMAAQAHPATGGVKETGRRFSWRTLGVVLAVAAPTSLLIVPYSITLLGQGHGPEIPLWALVVGTLIGAGARRRFRAPAPRSGTAIVRGSQLPVAVGGFSGLHQRRDQRRDPVPAGPDEPLRLRGSEALAAGRATHRRGGLDGDGAGHAAARAAHLPQAAALGGGLPASLVAFVLLPTASAGWPSAGCTGSGGSSPP
jgi:hypothetical protein